MISSSVPSGVLSGVLRDAGPGGRGSPQRVLRGALGAALASAALLGACGDGGGGEGGGGAGPVCFDYAGFDGSSPEVSFRQDVLPILRNSCGLSTSCHGSQGNPTQPYLGPNLKDPLTDADVQAIFEDNVGVPAAREPAMAIVEPGDPARSFLMHKVDGTLSCEALACAEQNACGAPMPQGAALLDRARRDVLRRWIAQGAKAD